MYAVYYLGNIAIAGKAWNVEILQKKKKKDEKKYKRRRSSVKFDGLEIILMFSCIIWS